MKIVVNELLTNLAQELTPNKNTHVVAVRPHLYRHLVPSGTLKMQILTTADVLVAESATINISAIASGHNYFHGYVRFELEAYLAKDTPYKFKLVSGGGYSFSESAFVGWVNDYDLEKYDNDTGSVSMLDRPLDLEVWEKKSK